ncbi:hypothetical protein HDU76_012255, partial [Blyttiomyces sp. JEL0837]
DLKKQIQPARAVKPNEKLEGWAELITAGLIYHDFNNSEDPNVFHEKIEGLYNAIRTSIAPHKDVGQPLTIEPVDPLAYWLQPVSFALDLEKFKRDYVPGTRDWSIRDIHHWLTEDSASLLWLNGGAGLGNSIIAFLASENLPPNFLLGSIFFCKHDDANKNNAKRVDKDTVRIARGEDSILNTPSIAFNELIIKGLNQIEQQSTNILIIVDALDEIGKQGDDTRNDFLHLIRDDVTKLPTWVRVFTTSRPELDIYETLKGVNS